MQTVSARKYLKSPGYKVKIKISEAKDNALEVKDDGSYMKTSDKADKVTGATAGHLAGLDANGNLTDSGHGIASDDDVTEMLNEVYGNPESNG